MVAKPGYAVAAMNVKSGANADGLSLTFMRINGDRLDPKDARAHNFLAWLLAVGPDGLRDGKRAVLHATRAHLLTRSGRRSG